MAGEYEQYGDEMTDMYYDEDWLYIEDAFGLAVGGLLLSRLAAA